MLVRTDFRTFHARTISDAHVRATACHVECEERSVLGAWLYQNGHVYVSDYRFPLWARTLVRKRNKQQPIRMPELRNFIKLQEMQHSPDGQTFTVKNTVTTYELGNYTSLIKSCLKDMVTLGRTHRAMTTPAVDPTVLYAYLVKLSKHFFTVRDESVIGISRLDIMMPSDIRGILFVLIIQLHLLNQLPRLKHMELGLNVN